MADWEDEMESFMEEASARADKIKLPPDTRTPEKKKADAKKSWETRQFAKAERARIHKVQMENARKRAENMSPEGRQFYRDRNRVTDPYK